MLGAFCAWAKCLAAVVSLQWLLWDDGLFGVDQTLVSAHTGVGCMAAAAAALYRFCRLQRGEIHTCAAACSQCVSG
jgi:hypothetical protein